jgi:hypothetical protein
MNRGWDKELMLASALYAALAFNLVFFLQELALVVPKAMLPGVHAILYHNNHTWTGMPPLAELLQGTGTLADLALGLAFAALLARAGARPIGLRLFFFWMAFQGLYQGLSQVLIGTVLPGNDAGMAMSYLGIEGTARIAVAIVAVLAMAAAGVWLMRQLLRKIATEDESARGMSRLGFALRTVTLPALVSVLLLIPYREPRNIIEVAVLPLIVVTSGLIWIQASTWFGPRSDNTARGTPDLLWPVVALAIVLAVFQLVLRPGVAFS